MENVLWVPERRVLRGREGLARQSRAEKPDPSRGPRQAGEAESAARGGKATELSQGKAQSQRAGRICPWSVLGPRVVPRAKWPLGEMKELGASGLPAGRAEDGRPSSLEGLEWQPGTGLESSGHRAVSRAVIPSGLC